MSFLVAWDIINLLLIVAYSINKENYIHKISDVKPSSQVLDELLNHDEFFYNSVSDLVS